jgi:peptide/nickel transport system permease protein
VIHLSRKQLISRLLQIVVVLVGISFITFFLTYLSPGDPVQNMYISMGQMPSEEIIEETREEMGLNDPFFVQYGRWLSNCLHGDFGNSYSLHRPVTDLLQERLVPTLKLTVMSLLLMLLFSVPLGVFSALYKDSWIDYLARGITFIGCAMPNFWVALLLILAFCVKFTIFPVISSEGNFKSLFLPALTLAIAMAAKYTRQVRTAVLEELNQDYVIGAQARGIKKSRIIWGNVFPNALLPLVTMLGLSVGSLLGGTSVVEVIFSYPGLGNLAVSAITSSDYYLIQGYVLWMALIYMVINLLVDVSYIYIDPRMRIKR